MLVVQVDKQGKYIRFCMIEDDAPEVIENEEGYIINVPFPDGFKRYVTEDKVFKFDLETYFAQVQADVEEYHNLSELWQEGLSEEEIEELTNPQELSETERIDQLEFENAMISLELIETQIRLETAETEQANLLLELVDKGVL